MMYERGGREGTDEEGDEIRRHIDREERDEPGPVRSQDVFLPSYSASAHRPTPLRPPLTIPNKTHSFRISSSPASPASCTTPRPSYTRCDPPRPFRRPIHAVMTTECTKRETNRNERFVRRTVLVLQQLSPSSPRDVDPHLSQRTDEDKAAKLKFPGDFRKKHPNQIIPFSRCSARCEGMKYDGEITRIFHISTANVDYSRKSDAAALLLVTLPPVGAATSTSSLTFGSIFGSDSSIFGCATSSAT